MKRSSSDGTLQGGGSSNGVKRQKSQPQVADPSWPLDKQHADAIINFLVRLACQVSLQPCTCTVHCTLPLYYEHTVYTCTLYTLVKLIIHAQSINYSLLVHVQYKREVQSCIHYYYHQFSIPPSQVNDAQSSSVPGSLPSSGEALSKRCVSLIRTALKPDLWPSE